MRWTWFLGVGLLVGAPFACGSGFTSDSTGGGGASSSTTGSPVGSGGMGAGAPCQDVSDCPSPSSQCESYACDGGMCARTVLPSGDVPNPIVGNCVAEVCDGAGNQTTTPDDSDVFVDGNECTKDLCVNHMPQNPPNTNAPCMDGNRVCDDTGTCVECIPGIKNCTGGRACVANQCVNAICANSMLDLSNGETDTDCGGPSCPACDDGSNCLLPRDCVNGVCNGVPKKCQPASCTDMVQNGTESDVDCGGSCTKKCGTGEGCADKADCASGVCTMGTCAAPACTCTGAACPGGGQVGDGVKNGSETDIDCGGPGCNKCHDGQHCGQDADCQTAHCDMNNNNVCDHCTDGIKDNSEGDVDCGASCVAPHVPAGQLCPVQSTCFGDQDCQSMACCDMGGGTPKLCQTTCM